MSDILHSKITGDHPKHFLILHGLFGQSDNFGTLAKHFSEYYTVHAIDLRNHGRSFHSDDMSFKAMAEDVLNYLDYHQIHQCYLLGHSLGGRAVIEFSYLHPERLEKLIVADIAPKAYPPHHQGIFKGLNLVDFDKVQKRTDVDEVLKNYIPEYSVRQFLLKNVYMQENGKYGFRFNLKVLTHWYDEMIEHEMTDGRFEKPTLFLRGEKSGYILDSDFDLIYGRFPNAVIKTIPNAGHWLHAENPKDFFDSIVEFLGK
ncbi:MAG: alpha/beta fold hydrolase [Moheibacter sp.]